jgi:hypothetical protein
MEISAYWTYLAHSVFALLLTTIYALLLFTQLGWIDFGSLQALGMLLGLFVGLPAGVIVLYSAVVVIVMLLRRQRVPRDMLLLPLALLVAIIWGSLFDRFETLPWTIVAGVPLACYLIMAPILLLRYRSSRRGSTG